MAQGEHVLLVGQGQCSFAMGALLIAQELLICVVHNEIRIGAVGIGFTDFETLVIKARRPYIKSERGTQYPTQEAMAVKENGMSSVNH